MNNKIKVSLIALACAAVSACTSSPNDELIAKLNQMEKRQMEIKEAQDKKEQAQREAEIEAAPSWVLSPPPSDATGVYGVGIAESKKLSHGLKAAKLQAEFELAKMFKQELSGSERAYEQGDSDGEVTTQTTFLIDKLVDSVLVVGFEVVEQKVVPINGVNNVYVLLKMPYEQFNKVLQAEKAKTLDSKVQVAFDDLERRLEKRRIQKEGEKQAEFERKQEALKSRAKILSGNDKEAKSPQAKTYDDSRSKKNTIEDIFLM